MGRLRPLKIYIKFYAIAALGLAYFPMFVAVLPPTLREVPSLDRSHGPVTFIHPKLLLMYR